MPDQPVDPAPPEPHSSGMEGRVSRLETFVEAMRNDIADIRQELRALRAETRNEASSLRGELATNFRWLVGLLLTLMLAMIGGFAAMYSQIAAILARLPK